MKKRILIVYFSQTGQLGRVLRNVSAPLAEASDVELHFEELKPAKPYPFPWPMLAFFDRFPESVHLAPPPLQPVGDAARGRYDLVILGYQAWYLSPSQPTTAFLKTPEAAALLRNTPVVTVIACRNMWLMAQEDVKRMLGELGARLVGNIALVDQAGSLGSFLATPIWMFTGKRGPRLGGLIPKAGVSDAEIEASRRFGERMLERLRSGAPLDETLLRGTGAVKINAGLISSEKAGKRGFLVWGRLLRAIGPEGHPLRKPVLVLFIVYLFLLIITVVPLGMLLKKLFAPLVRRKTEAQRAYFSQPSGE